MGKFMEGGDIPSESHGRNISEIGKGHEARAIESAERQILEDATIQPEAIVEQTGDIQQAESLEKIVAEMIIPPQETAPQILERAAIEPSPEIAAALAPEQREIYNSFNPDEQATLIRFVEQSRVIDPGKLVGHSGGLVY